MRSHPFPSEICVKTLFGSLCFPIGTGPTVPYPSERSGETDLIGWSIVRSPQGEVSRAASRVGATDLLFSNRIQRTDEHTTKIFTFSHNGREFLSVGGRAHHHSDSVKSKCACRLSMFAKGEDIDYTIDVAAESCSTVRVLARTNGSVIERTLDLLSPESFQIESGLGICRALGEAHLDQLTPFNELLVLVGDYYWAQGRREVAALADMLKNPGDGGTQASFWCGVARATCWGLAAAGGGTCCIGTAAVGCALCAGGFGAAGSACSEAWSWC